MIDFAEKVKIAEPGKTHLFYVGQAGYILKSKRGQLLGVDLYFSDCLERLEGHIGFKRLLPKILEPNELVFHYIIATHPHYDHFDFASIPQFLNGKTTKLYASVNCEKEVKQLKLEDSNIMYVKPGDEVESGDFKIKFVDCDHGTGAPDAVGVMLDVDGIRIYMAGDTCLRLDRVDALLADGNIDYLIGPINGAYGNMNENDFAMLSSALHPRVTIPSHYGMFASHGGNPGVFMEHMKEICPQNKYLLLALGEQIEL